jgi:F0F1-type ATP synthase membrane subunit c/vacuolar-type H+-ATPase subunit K
MGCFGCVSIGGMELDQQPTQSPGPAWWRPPKAIVWLGALLILSVGQSVDAWPSWSIWLALATALLMLLVMVQVAGQEESIGPIAAGRERLRAERRWRWWAIAGWMLLTVATALLAVRVLLWDWNLSGSPASAGVPPAAEPGIWMVAAAAWTIPNLLLAPRSWRRLRLRTTKRRHGGGWPEATPAKSAPAPGIEHGPGPVSDTDRPLATGSDAVSGQSGNLSHHRYEAGEDKHQTPASMTPLFRYQRRHRQLTIWPDGTLQEEDLRKKAETRVSLIYALSVSVDYEGEITIVGREKVLARETRVVVWDRHGRKTVVALHWGMPISVKQELERVAASFSPSVAASLATEASAASRQVAGWRVKVATVSAWTSGLGGVAAGIVFSVIADSGVESDQTDPRLWGAMVVCSGLAATAFLTFLDPPVSRGRIGLGIAGVAGLLVIPLAWPFLTGADTTGVGALKVGECVQDDTPRDKVQVETVDVVPCRQPHDVEVFAIVPLAGQVLPAEAELERLADHACAAQFRTYVGVASQATQLRFDWWAPTKESWASGDRTVLCVLENADASRLVGSMHASGGRSTPELPTVKLDRTANLGVFHIHLTTMTCGYPTLAGLGAAKRGQYCIVEVTATNVRASPARLDDANQRLSVATGESFEGFGFGDPLWKDELKPGQRLTTRLLFDLPRGARPVQLRLQADAYQHWGQDVAIINLPRS